MERITQCLWEEQAEVDRLARHCNNALAAADARKQAAIRALDLAERALQQQPGDRAAKHGAVEAARRELNAAVRRAVELQALAQQVAEIAIALPCLHESQRSLQSAVRGYSAKMDFAYEHLFLIREAAAHAPLGVPSVPTPRIRSFETICPNAPLAFNISECRQTLDALRAAWTDSVGVRITVLAGRSLADATAIANALRNLSERRKAIGKHLNGLR